MIKNVIIPPRLLVGITSNRRKYQMNLVCIGADTETIQGKPDTFQLHYVVYDGSPVQIIRRFKSGFPLTQLLVELKRRFDDNNHLVLFFHNLNFDAGVLFYGKHETLVSSKVEFKINSIGFAGTLLYGKVHTLYGRFSEGLSISFIDTSHYFQTSLARLATTFCPNLPKLKKPKGLGEIKYELSDEKFYLYAMRDAEICYHVGKFILKQHKKFDVRLSISAPQFAARVFKHKFIPEGARIPFPPQWIREAAELSFHGGRNALWVKPGLYKNVTEIDIVSAYPFAMTQIPNFLEGHYGREDKRCNGFILKIRLQRQGRFPNIYTHDFRIAKEGDIVWITSYEYESLRKAGGFARILSKYFITSREKLNPLKNYAMEMFAKKDEYKDDPAMYYFYKVGLLNSLYGKFVETRVNEDAPDIVYDSAGFADCSKTFIAGTLYNPFIATLITGFTRAYLHQLEIRYSALHSSTDSILTQKRVKEIKGLGGISIKCKGTALLIRPKLYVIWNDEGKIIRYATHGFWGTPYQLIKAIKQENLSYQVKHMNKIRESLRQGLTPLMMQKIDRTLNITPELTNDLKQQLIGAGL